MFCRHCGNQIYDDAKFCQDCGAAINDGTPTPPIYQAQTRSPYQNQAQYGAPTSQENTLAIVGFVLAFFVPLAGLICSIIGYNNSKKGCKYGGLALAGMIVSIVFLVIEVIAIILIIIYISSFYNPFFYLYYY